MLSLFFSYSHRDEAARNELEKHLSMLKRQGVISSWHDRRIDAGGHIDREISEKLDSADIILLLVSPDFLASDYCFDVEMERAIARHEAGEARVIPVILEPCDWHTAPFGRLRATPPDGKPVSKHPNVNDAYLAVVQDIRAVVSDLAQSAPAGAATDARILTRGAEEKRTAQQRSSNLRLKRLFTDKEKDDYLEECFGYIAAFFENSLGELQHRNVGIEGRYRRIDSRSFESSVYSRGSVTSQCRIWLSTRSTLSQGIAFSSGSAISNGAFNELLSVEDDGYTLGLRAMMGSAHGAQRDALMTSEGASEYLWGLFIDRLQ